MQWVCHLWLPTSPFAIPGTVTMSVFLSLDASGDALGFLLAAEGLLTASHSRVPNDLLDPQV